MVVLQLQEVLDCQGINLDRVVKVHMVNTRKVLRLVPSVDPTLESFEDLRLLEPIPTGGHATIPDLQLESNRWVQVKFVNHATLMRMI